jgi:hypothetical protein
METKVYVELKNPIKTAGDTDGLNELRINVDYQKAGYNYFSGTPSEGGVYVYLTPVMRGGMFVRQVITGSQHESGYKILLKPLNRKSQKQIDLMAERVIPKAQQIADLYSECKHREVYDFIKQLIE